MNLVSTPSISASEELAKIKQAIEGFCQDCSWPFIYQMNNNGETFCPNLECQLREWSRFREKKKFYNWHWSREKLVKETEILEIEANESKFE